MAIGSTVKSNCWYPNTVLGSAWWKIYLTLSITQDIFFSTSQFFFFFSPAFFSSPGIYLFRHILVIGEGPLKESSRQNPIVSEKDLAVSFSGTWQAIEEVTFSNRKMKVCIQDDFSTWRSEVNYMLGWSVCGTESFITLLFFLNGGFYLSFFLRQPFSVRWETESSIIIRMWGEILMTGGLGFLILNSILIILCLSLLSFDLLFVEVQSTEYHFIHFWNLYLILFFIKANFRGVWLFNSLILIFSYF